MISDRFIYDDRKTYVIFGAAESGIKCLQILLANGLKNICFADNRQELWGQSIQGIEVISFDRLYDMDKRETLIIIASSAYADIHEQLSYAGFVNIFSYVKHIDINTKRKIMDNCREPLQRVLLTGMEAAWYRKAGPLREAAVLLCNCDKLQEAYDMLEDAASKQCLLNVLEYRFTQEGRLLEEIYEPVQYFTDVYPIHDQEVLIDGGACQGDTVLNFKKYTSDRFKRIYCFEPNPAYALGMKYLFQKDNRIEVINQGLYSESKRLEFSVKGHGSSLQKGGDMVVYTVSIDDCVQEQVSFIKMDIEGAELEALIGARKTIQRDKPKLAICAYHKPEDLWTLPFYIKELLPEYKLYLKHHSISNLWETVLYAWV